MQKIIHLIYIVQINVNAHWKNLLQNLYLFHFQLLSNKLSLIQITIKERSKGKEIGDFQSYVPTTWKWESFFFLALLWIPTCHMCYDMNTIFFGKKNPSWISNWKNTFLPLLTFVYFSCRVKLNIVSPSPCCYPNIK